MTTEEMEIKAQAVLIERGMDPLTAQEYLFSNRPFWDYETVETIVAEIEKWHREDTARAAKFREEPVCQTKSYLPEDWD